MQDVRVFCDKALDRMTHAVSTLGDVEGHDSDCRTGQLFDQHFIVNFDREIVSY